ncbi:MAG: FAD-dependent oxidoreductase [Kiritimatiellae bacterium]|nr:FAD-dependent oxidoreductase [Kiritimatiellia bacterium]
MTHEADLCVVGGGMAGVCAAIAAARRGAQVVLMHDRPVLGGNASSEIRMWIRGARGENNRETGIVEEIELENLRRNPTANYSIWDSVLYEKVRYQPGITLLLNCSCCEAEVRNDSIISVKGWQFTTETWHTVRAGFFADCSGDGILAPLSGAEFRLGREGEGEFGESIAPESSDRKTMGMSCLLQARETDRSQPFIPPTWAYTFESDSDLPWRDHDLTKWTTNFWWVELGGDRDSIHDAEDVRDELLKIVFGVWDHIKNRGDHGAENWVLEWVGFLPGKRESRRLMGDHVVTQNDILAGGKFEDVVAYGGWSMDDHHPGGFWYKGPPTVFHPVPSPYGLPYRSLYSRNVDNLFFAGRNISASHAAMSSIRVMGTCALLGQAVGTAAAIAAAAGLTPRGVMRQRLKELQQALMDDDCYFPGLVRDVSSLVLRARLSASSGDPEPIRNGIDRPVFGSGNAWVATPGEYVEFRFDREVHFNGIRLVFDSDLNRDRRMGMNALYPREMPVLRVPPTLVKAFKVEVEEAPGKWERIIAVEDNHQRLVRLPIRACGIALRFTPLASWGNRTMRVFAIDLL